MATTKAKRHTHKYHHIGKYTKYWACALPDCTHSMPAHLEDSIPGKYSLCWQCGGQFILNSENMKLDRPICESCKAGIKDDVDFDDIVASIRKEIGK